MNRTARLKELENLWLTVMKQPLEKFDAAINKRFQVADGRDSLDYETMDKIEKGLREYERNNKRN